MNQDIPPHRYTAALATEIEARWQERWDTEGMFTAANPAGPWAEPDDPRLANDRGHLMIMDMFPYPSGTGMHVGHPLGYVATDVYARFQRTTGKNVLHTMGFDAFGLPAEQYAVQTGQHPRATTEANIETYLRQWRQLGLGHEARRRVSTFDPDYYRWTQWIFTQIYNAWYDADAPRDDGGTGRARPIAELIEQFISGERLTPGRQPWEELNHVEQAAILDDHRLAYVSSAPVNWAPGLGTVVSNEEVTNQGLTERGDFPVFRRNLSQWMMRITAYADRLVDDLDRLDWPEQVKAMQRNWIGRSTGALVRFTASTATPAKAPAQTRSDRVDIEVFTTRPDTLFGATFMVLAPEHPLLDQIVPAQWPTDTDPIWAGAAANPQAAVTAYRRAASTKSDLERQADSKAKTGVFTGARATNPVTGQPIPVFVADYVLMGYGTGAIMAVPGQDQRDWDFARAYNLPIVRTVQPSQGHPDHEAFVGEGPAINSANASISLTGLEVAEAKAAIIDWLVARGSGEATVTYRLRDWLFSRQRYWGEPFPVLWDVDGVAHAVPDDMLPVELPDVPDYSPRTYDPQDADSMPEAPLARATEWVEVELDIGDGLQTYRRDTNTMPNWAGSCWYHLRYLDPANTDLPVDPEVEKYWIGPRENAVADAPEGAVDVGGVDLYIGGVEHAVLHLLYARFWHKVLHDLGYVSSEEPFRRLINQGMIEAYVYRDSRGQPVPASEVIEHPDHAGGASSYTWNDQPVRQEHGKMGKSLKNVVTPDDICDEYGADTFRVYEMSMGPLEQYRPWETRAVVGSQRFLQRLWRNVIDEDSGEVSVGEEAMPVEVAKSLHRTIDAVRADYQGIRFNTAIAKMIEFNNVLTKLDVVPREAVEPLVQMAAPVAPHLAEELWSRLGHADSLAFAPFPIADPDLLAQESVTCVVQVKGKVRDRIEVAADIDEATLRELALGTERIRALLGGQPPRIVIVRAPGLVNIVPA
ncbi:MAG: leucine--tRNA ligase [Ornithinimicrobium sp.]